MDVALWIVAGVVALLVVVVVATRRPPTSVAPADQGPADAGADELLAHVEDLADRGHVTDESREHLRTVIDRHRRREDDDA